MKFVVVNVGSTVIAEALVHECPARLGLFHRFIDVLHCKGIPYAISFFDKDDPDLMHQFDFHDRFVFGLRSLEQGDI